jgi:hypothetical protein
VQTEKKARQEACTVDRRPQQMGPNSLLQKIVIIAPTELSFTSGDSFEDTQFKPWIGFVKS